MSILFTKLLVTFRRKTISHLHSEAWYLFISDYNQHVFVLKSFFYNHYLYSRSTDGFVEWVSSP